MIDNQKILYKFIQINANVNWTDISYYQNLSENIIREFQNKVNRYCIYKYQKLSKNYQKI